MKLEQLMQHDFREKIKILPIEPVNLIEEQPHFEELKKTFSNTFLKGKQKQLLEYHFLYLKETYFLRGIKELFNWQIINLI